MGREMPSPVIEYGHTPHKNALILVRPPHVVERIVCQLENMGRERLLVV